MKLKNFLAECNNLGVPEPDFRETFCKTCTNAECERSLVNHLPVYEERVTTWRERLFTKVPRLDPRDPRAQAIASQDFKESNLERWADPHALPKVSGQVPALYQGGSPVSPALPIHVAGQNTPNPGEVMLPGSASSGERVVSPGSKIRLG